MRIKRHTAILKSSGIAYACTMLLEKGLIVKKLLGLKGDIVVKCPYFFPSLSRRDCKIQVRIWHSMTIPSTTKFCLLINLCWTDQTCQLMVIAFQELTYCTSTVLRGCTHIVIWSVLLLTIISCVTTIRGTTLPNDEPEQGSGWQRVMALFEIRYCM